MAEATGLLKSFSVNNGWTGIEVEGAPKGISTKKADVVAAVKELVGSVVTISYTEKPSDKINENTGQPYVNRWLNSVVPASGQAQAPAPAVTPEPSATVSPSTAGPGYSKDTDIRRQAIAKAIGHREFKNPAEFIQWANAIESWIVGGSQATFGAPDDPDSDIPF